MSKKAKPQVTTNEPWKAVQPYLTGGNNIKGIFPEAQRMFESGGFTPNMQNAVDAYSQGLMTRAQDPINGQLQTGAQQVMHGAYDSQFGPVANTNNIDVNMVKARQGQGSLDPTAALKSMLSGQPDNPYLQQQANALTANLTRNLNENVMPGIRSEALASGQYGGSRQGIAEGLAASRLNQDIAPAVTNLFGGAYENAQNRKFGTASQLNDQAFQNATNNANRNINTQQFNANLGLQNNSQLMQKNQANLANRTQGVNLYNTANGMQDDTFQKYMQAQGMPQGYNWQNLNNYANIISPGAGMGGTNSQTMTKNVGAGMLGGALGGASLGSAFGPAGMAIGGGLGALSGLF